MVERALLLEVFSKFNVEICEAEYGPLSHCSIVECTVRRPLTCNLVISYPGGVPKFCIKFKSGAAEKWGFKFRKPPTLVFTVLLPLSCRRIRLAIGEIK